MKIRQVLADKKRYLALLLLGDEQESMIDRYLSRGELFVMEEEGEARAVCVVTDEGGGVLEIKNLAVDPAVQRRGLPSRGAQKGEANQGSLPPFEFPLLSLGCRS